MFRATTARTFSMSQLPKVLWTPDLVCFSARTAYIFSTSQVPKVFRTWGVFSFFICKTTACTFSTSQFPKVVQEWYVLYILIWKYASRHNGVHFFDISPSKSGPTMVCFVHNFLRPFFPNPHPSWYWKATNLPSLPLAAKLTYSRMLCICGV
jgi:hypothetical protein